MMFRTHTTDTRLRPASSRPERGFTLIEMMVAMAIGLVLILGAVNIYAQGRQSFRTAESIARIQENARFALDLMGPDIRLVNYWGRSSEAAYIAPPGAGLVVTCNAADVSAWALNMANGIEAIDDGYTLPCPAFSGAQPGTDVLVLRHASGQPVAPTAGRLQIQSGRISAVMFNTGIIPLGSVPAPPASGTHDMVINAYYVDQQSSLGATVPSLRRLTLVPGAGAGTLQDQEIIPGVESLQVQLGIDTTDDGAADRYVDADAGIILPGDIAFDPDAEIVSVRLWMLVRAEQRENAHMDAGPYVPPDADLAAITPNDQFRRMAVTTTIKLRNTGS